MAVPFLQQVAEYLLQHHKDTLESCCVVLPNKRASLFLKQHLAKASGKTLWLPKIIGAEDFFAELSGLTVLEEIDLVCRLYGSYCACYGKDAETFDAFSKWATLLLQDFNEVDRYLVDSHQIYENLRNIKEIENWSLGEEVLSEQQQNYLAFMSLQGKIYDHFNAQLLEKNQAYQGMVYRKAVQSFENSALISAHSKFIFCGFNAINAAEEKIIHSLYRMGKVELLWDCDAYYMNSTEQEAGLFLRRLIPLMPDARSIDPEENFKEPKTIQVVSVPKQMGQAMVVKQTIEQFLKQGVSPDQIAVVLANEKLLWPLLQQLPDGIEQVNITMQYPLRFTPAYSLLDSLIQLQHSFSRRHKSSQAVYYQDFTQVVKEPLFVLYMQSKASEADPNRILHQIRNSNIAFLSPSLLKEFFGSTYSFVQSFFEPATDFILFTNRLKELLESVMEQLKKDSANTHRLLELEFIQVILHQFTRLVELIREYPHFNQLAAYRQLFHQVVGSSSAPFSGEPLKGLQIMGILESRTLDFEHLVLVNVNEGVLPSGKSTHSFLPNDLKRAFGLPLYTEKDAVYAYHFYRLLQRSRQVCITYDSETDTFGKGEKSRFVTQLALELPVYSKSTIFREEVAAYDQLPAEKELIISIQKDPAVQLKIIEKATSNEIYKGLSPSALISYKDCALRFYFRYSAGLKESEEVEESAENNTLGTILHESLENLYKDCCALPLNAGLLLEKKEQIPSVVRASFLSTFAVQDLFGKSLLQEEVIKVYVHKQVKNDQQSLEKLAGHHQPFQLLYLEHELSASLRLPTGTHPPEVFIKGKADRIDLYGDKFRIIDYKSSIKSGDAFEFKSFDPLFNNPKYNKQLQLFIYAWLSFKNNLAPAKKIQPGIIAFKQYSEEPKYILYGKQPLVFTETLFAEFESALSEFVAGIFDPSKNYDQTDDRDQCRYCAYQTICNRL